MKINLIDNAVDSLQIAMRAFSLWNEDCESRYSFRYLKVTIEFLHNAMELLLKAIHLKSWLINLPFCLAILKHALKWVLRGGNVYKINFLVL